MRGVRSRAAARTTASTCAGDRVIETGRCGWLAIGRSILAAQMSVRIACFCLASPGEAHPSGRRRALADRLTAPSARRRVASSAAMTITITLPDGKALELPDGATGADAASAIGPGLARAALAVEVSDGSGAQDGAAGG